MKSINLTYYSNIILISTLMLIIFFIIYYQGYKSLTYNFFHKKNDRNEKKFFIFYWSICCILSFSSLFIFIFEINLSKKIRFFTLYPTYIWFFSFLILLISRLIYNSFILFIKLIKFLHFVITKPQIIDSKKVKIASYSFYLFSIFFLCVLSMYQAQSTNNIKIKRIKIMYPNIFPKLKGLTITHLSDIHFGHFMKYSDFEPIANVINKINSDLLVISGDFISQSQNNLLEMEKGLSFLRQHKYGNYSSLGNHDHIVNIDSFKESLSKSSTLLINEEIIFPIDNTNDYSKIRIIGVDYPFLTDRIGGKEEQFEYLLKKSINKIDSLDKTFNILISHHPDLFLISSKMNIHLTLAGHSHGGQISILNFNPVNAFFDFTLGLYKIDNNYLYVNPGLSSWIPFRLGVNPEITVITIL